MRKTDPFAGFCRDSAASGMRCGHPGRPRIGAHCNRGLHRPRRQLRRQVQLQPPRASRSDPRPRRPVGPRARLLWQQKHQRQLPTLQNHDRWQPATTCSRPEDKAGYWIPTVSWKNSTGRLTTLHGQPRRLLLQGGPQGLPDRPAFRSRPEAHKRSAHHVVLRDKRQRRWLCHPAHTVQRWRAQLEDHPSPTASPRGT